MATFTADRTNPDRCPITYDDLGYVGLAERIARTSRSGRPRPQWRGVTPSGEESAAFEYQRDAAVWLRMRAKPPTPRPAEPIDPIIELVQRHLRNGQQAQADSAVLACIVEDIRQMRADRVRHSVPAVWHHLERFEAWIDALNMLPDGLQTTVGDDDSTQLHPRTLELVRMATRR